MKYFFLAFCVVWAIGASAQLKDTLYLKNGSRIIGQIKKIMIGEVTFDPDDIGDITVQTQKLTGFAAVRKLFRVETTDKLVYFGKILPDTTPGMVLIITDVDTVRLSVEKITVIYPFQDEFKQRFSGSASAGFDYSRSSGLGRINLDGTVNYFAKKDEIVLAVSAIYTITDTAFTRDREDISLKYNYYVSPKWFTTLFVRTQRNLELGLLRRFQEGLGGGNKFITNRQMYAWARTGIVLNQEKNSEDVNSGALTELFGQAEVNYFRIAKNKVTADLTEAVYFSLTQKGRVRNDAELSLIWEVIRNLNISFSAYSNFDSQPATEGSRKMDIGTVFSLSITF